MSEQYNKEASTSIFLSECADKLKSSGITEDRTEELIEKLRNSLENDDLITTITESIIDRHDNRKKVTKEEDFSKIVRGLLFESIALESLPKEQKQFKELERFLLWTLKDPLMWFPAWEQRGLASLSKEERELFNEYTIVMQEVKELKDLKYNDAISLTIEKDPDSNKTVAVITGVIEAKNHRLLPNTGDEDQMQTAPRVLAYTINRYGKYLPLIFKGLGLDYIQLDEIRILPARELSYTVMQPIDIDYGKKGPQGAFRKCNIQYVDVTKNEIFLMGEALKEVIREELPFKI